VNTAERISALQGLLARIQKNAALPRPPRRSAGSVAPPAPVHEGPSAAGPRPSTLPFPRAMLSPQAAPRPMVRLDRPPSHQPPPLPAAPARDLGPSPLLELDMDDELLRGAVVTMPGETDDAEVLSLDESDVILEDAPRAARAVERAAAEEERRRREAEEWARLEDEARRLEAEEERLAKEQHERVVARKIEEERLAIEAADAARKIEEERLAIEADDAARKIEEERFALEAAEAGRRAGEQRLAIEVAEAAREAEEERLAIEAAEAARRADEEERLARQAADAARRRAEEEERFAIELAEAARRAEEERLAIEAAEAARRADEERLAIEAAEAARKIEEERIALEAAEAAHRADEERIALEAAEATRRIEEMRRAREAAERAEAELVLAQQLDAEHLAQQRLVEEAKLAREMAERATVEPIVEAAAAKDEAPPASVRQPRDQDWSIDEGLPGFEDEPPTSGEVSSQRKPVLHDDGEAPAAHAELSVEPPPSIEEAASEVRIVIEPPPAPAHVPALLEALPPLVVEVEAAVVRRRPLSGDAASFLGAVRGEQAAGFGALLDDALALGA
jgi:hypothetical protein